MPNVTKVRSQPIHVLTKVLDASQGVVEALVAVTGNRDLQGDVILPGALSFGLGHVRPKGVWHHDWTSPIAKTLEAAEVTPNDASLPADLLTGGFGGLRVRSQFNLETASGADAFKNVKFYGEEQEWSIGYEIPDGGAFFAGATLGLGAVAERGLQLPTTTKESAEEAEVPTRFITKLTVWEYSPVLFGANRLTRTEAAKAADDLVQGVLERINVVLAPAMATAASVTVEGEPPKGEDACLVELETAVNYVTAWAGDEKAGRVQARRNVDRLQRIRDAVDQMLSELEDEEAGAPPPEEPPKLHELDLLKHQQLRARL